MSVEKFLKIGQQMSAKVPHTHGSGIFFQKSVTHGVTTKMGTHTSYRINLIPFKISSFATCGISEA